MRGRASPISFKHKNLPQNETSILHGSVEVKSLAPYLKKFSMKILNNITGINDAFYLIIPRKIKVVKYPEVMKHNGYSRIQFKNRLDN